MEIHNIPAYYNEDSEILILGSFPSVKSREVGFYYAHNKNRFWQVLSLIYKESINNDIASKKAFLKKHKIALFDVCYSCNINKSSDGSIKNVVPNNIKDILIKTNIKKIYTTGKTAYNLYNKYLKESLGINAIYLPSTSGANASYSIDKLVREYQVIKCVK